MSLETQEQVLLRLLFERPFRQRFATDRAAALAAFDLTESEREDFLRIDSEGLAVDADDRENRVIARLVASYPMSAALLSALPRGLDLIRGAVGAAHFMRPALERPSAFGETLDEGIQRGEVACSDVVRGFLRNVLGWEKALAMSAASVREAALRGSFDSAGPEPSRSAQDARISWMELSLGLAANLIVYQLPAAIETLRSALTPAPANQMWGRLLQASLPLQRLEELVAAAKTDRVIFARTRLIFQSRCEADATHDVLEAPSGFIPILQSLDGVRTGREIVDQLVAAGASERIVTAVRRCFDQLIAAGMIVVNV